MSVWVVVVWFAAVCSGPPVLQRTTSTITNQQYYHLLSRLGRGQTRRAVSDVFFGWFIVSSSLVKSAHHRPRQAFLLHLFSSNDGKRLTLITPGTSIAHIFSTLHRLFIKKILLPGSVFAAG